MSQLASKELAVKLKAAGYDVPCDHRYAQNSYPIMDGTFNWNAPYNILNTCSAPCLDAVCDWLRTLHWLHCFADICNGGWVAYITEIKGFRNPYASSETDNYYTSHELALSAAITHALDLVHAKSKGK